MSIAERKGFFVLLRKPQEFHFEHDFDTENQLFKLKNSKLNLDYGFSCQLNVNKQLNDFTLRRNNSRFFLNGIDQEHFSMDIVNSLQFDIVKHINLSINASLGYNYFISEKLQFSQLILIGFKYEFNPQIDRTKKLFRD